MKWLQTIIPKVIGIGVLALLRLTAVLMVYLIRHIDRYVHVPMISNPSPPPVSPAAIMERP